MADFKLTQEDQDEFKFVVSGDDLHDFEFRFNTSETLKLFAVANECIGDHWRQGQAIKAEFLRHKEDPRRSEIAEDDGYAMDDPKSDGYLDRMVD